MCLRPQITLAGARTASAGERLSHRIRHSAASASARARGGAVRAWSGPTEAAAGPCGERRVAPSDPVFYTTRAVGGTGPWL